MVFICLCLVIKVSYFVLPVVKFLKQAGQLHTPSSRGSCCPPYRVDLIGYIRLHWVDLF